MKLASYKLYDTIHIVNFNGCTRVCTQISRHLFHLVTYVMITLIEKEPMLSDTAITIFLKSKIFFIVSSLANRMGIVDCVISPEYTSDVNQVVC